MGRMQNWFLLRLKDYPMPAIALDYDSSDCTVIFIDFDADYSIF